MNSTLRARLLARIIIDPSGCLLWTGEIDSHGYGRIWASRANPRGRVHRLVYEMFAGPIPDGLRIDHLCRVRHCANVAHMEVVTHRVNTLRGIGPTAVNASVTHCPQGHEYDLLNTYFGTDGHRRCRRCRARRRKGNPS